MANVPFGDLKRQYAAYHEEYDAAVRRVLERGWFVLGQEGQAFEEEWAAWCDAPFAVGCNSGMDAIHLGLAAHGIGRGHRVITAANTCVPTVAAISASGAEIGLCDIDPSTGLMSPDALEEELARRPAQAVVPVHLYGQSADLESISAIAERHGAVIVQDAAQAHGALYKGRRIGSHGGTVAWSFYPSKNLGAFGDGGAVTTSSPQIAERLRMLRNYGQERRYVHALPGINSRLDEVQAAILRIRLPRLEEENARRRAIAQRYRTEISAPGVTFVGGAPHSVSCEHLFPIRLENRTVIQQRLTETGVETLIHYPIPVHLQPGYRDLGYQRGDLPSAEMLCDSVLSLPMYPELTDAEVNQVTRAVNSLG